MVFNRTGILIWLLILCLSCKDSPLENKTQDSRISVLQLEVPEEVSLPIKIRKLDSLIQNSKESKPDSLNLELHNTKGLLLYRLGAMDSFFYENKVLWKKAFHDNHQYFLGKSAFNIAYYFNEVEYKFDSAFYYYNVSKNAFLRYGDTAQAGKKLLNAGIIQTRKNDFFGAKETLTQAISFLMDRDEAKYLSAAYNQLGTCYKELKDFDNAIDFYKKAIHTSDSPKDIFSYQNNLALVYSELNDYLSAEEVLEGLKPKPSDDLPKKTLARILHNLSYFKWKNGKTDFKEGLLNALEIRNEIGDKRGLITSYLDIAEVAKTSNPIESKMYLDNAISMAKQIGMPKGEIDALEQYLVLEPQNIKHKDRYIFLKDSLYQQELKVKTQFAKMKYDDEQEKARLLALEAETAQNEAQLAREETQRILLLSLLAVLLMGGGSYYFILHQQHKKRTLQEIYNTEKKISKKIHDGLANDVYGVMTAVQHQDNAPNEAILDQLEDIYKRTRDISHDTRELATGKAFAIELKDMLQGFSGNGTKVLIKGMEGISWEKLNEHKCVALHRTLKELLVNMKKHSGAGLVALNFKEEKRKLQVDYSDNGIGVKREQKQGVGLQNTENRIQSVGGQFIFGGIEGKGVKVTLSIPI